VLLTPEGIADAGEQDADMASTATVLTCSPNPFGRTTGIRFELSQSSRVILRVFDVGGRAVRQLVNGEPQNAGPHRIQWDGRDDGGRELAGGIYRLRLEAGGPARVGSIVLLR
jgi:flagellar hook assembly protein FlgD